MEAMVDRNLFTGYRVGEVDQVSISHLQFADDTLLLGVKSWANVRALRAVLVLFEALSGLKVNFNKSMLVGVNIAESWLCEAASLLCCRVGKIPFLYLGLPIGGDPRRLSFWEPVLARLKNRLIGWKSRFLSFGGRLTLLKSVLTSLPVYALSFFKAPSGTISSIESLLVKFFWGGREDNRKISWINWQTICLRKEYGGLGVRQLREFNTALLGKWCWRMLVDREGLWFRVLAARYGVERGRVREGGRRGSSWWREIVRIRDTGGGLGGGWFGENISKKLREFNTALLGKWCWRMLVDREGLWFRVLAARYGVERGRVREGGRRGSSWWREIVRIRDTGEGLGEGGSGRIFRKRFERLFDLAENKSATVAEMFALGWEAGGEAWVWRRLLRGWEEEELRECQTLLSTLSLQDHSSDSWQWQPDPVTGYSVRGAYHLLTSQDSVTLGVAAGLIWHPQVPLKVSIFAWRLLRDRLPSKTNLVSRDILSLEAHHCVFGCGMAESAQHLFLSCSICGSLWSLISLWIGSSLVDSQALSDHFIQFISSAGDSRARRSLLQLIWLACVWVMWHERNQRLFRGSSNPLSHMLDKIKLLTYRWLKATNNNLALNYHSWWSSPLVCMGLV
ncbi:hypothetical protein TSUD_318650 [Trifolium subterraneum]|uniref:Reverse transcriptase zinc-binding domain-containing protein n=1 Tax=Trifolium subterraneum TaxID=3900 RepID=A0A2Z6N301_TRISU|nr:hypothetical protein TSUD_318650 [Trifolium subterraneum]